MTDRLLRFKAIVNTTILALLSVYFFLIPAWTIARELSDPAIRDGSIPSFGFHLHRSLSRRIGPWARDRVASGAAAELSQSDITGTEWPLFSAVFYLWSTEAIQSAWESYPSVAPIEPAVYARDAIHAAAALVADPGHATWVKRYWGDDYLHQQNLFYRMLVIGGLASYEAITSDTRYQAILDDQARTLAAELEASPFGLLDDYPGQCYPIDILPAVAVIQRAGDLLDQDTTDFTSRAVRAFEDPLLDPANGLPTYAADSRTGLGVGPARGVGVSYMLIWAPELWPDVADRWYERFEDHFWQRGAVLAGVREFDRLGSWPEWWMDVDSGPVLDGIGTAASGFGIGATRANGRFDQAFPLSAEALVVSWPMADGTLLLPRLLSKMTDAPYLAESAILFSLTRSPGDSEIILPQRGRLPLAVYAGLALYLIAGITGMVLARRVLRAPSAALKPNATMALPHWRFGVWLGLIATAAVFTVAGKTFVGLVALALALALPVKQNAEIA